MNVRCEWLVLCQRVISSEESKNLTLVECYEQIQALSFPANHAGFAFAARYVREGEAEDVPASFRFVRVSEHEPESVVAELDGTWGSDASVVRVFVNFATLRLVRPEILRFRIDHRIGDAEDWSPGASTQLEIGQLALTDEAREEVVARLEEAGHEVPDGLL